MSMMTHLASATNVTTFELQWRDWFYLTPNMGQDKYEDILYQLKLVQRNVNPPTGNTLGPVTNIPLGTILSLYHSLRFDASSRNIANNTFNRFTIVLNNLAGTYPEIGSYLTDASTHETTVENDQQERGRKTLRGKYNI